jgi:hypothetical protein
MEYVNSQNGNGAVKTSMVAITLSRQLAALGSSENETTNLCHPERAHRRFWFVSVRDEGSLLVVGLHEKQGTFAALHFR